MRRLYAIFAVMAAALPLMAADYFEAAEQKARIEALSKQLDKSSAYYTAFWDTLNMQMESIDNAFETAYVNERDIDSLVDATLAGMDYKFARMVQDYEALFTTMQSWENELSSMMYRIQVIEYDVSGKGHPVGVQGVWDTIQAHIPNLPNPFVTCNGSFWSNPASDEFASGIYRAACDFEKCDCKELHGKSNIQDIRDLMKSIRSNSLKVVELRQHPPTWR